MKREIVHMLNLGTGKVTWFEILYDFRLEQWKSEIEESNTNVVMVWKLIMVKRCSFDWAVWFSYEFVGILIKATKGWNSELGVVYWNKIILVVSKI